MATTKSRGQRARALESIMDAEVALRKRFAREIASALSPEARERLANLSLAERKALTKRLEALIDRIDRAQGAA